MTENQSKQQLIRLNTVTDVVYGITIWRFFDIIPKPKMVSFGVQELNSYLSENFMILIVGLVGILVTSIYWIQNNTLSATLKGSDARHSALRLVLKDVTYSDTRQLSIIIIAEPVTALFTIFFINSQWLWELSWLSYPIIKN